jgi:hypothetical protein
MSLPSKARLVQGVILWFGPKAGGGLPQKPGYLPFYPSEVTSEVVKKDTHRLEIAN